MLGAMLQETECLPMDSVMSVLTETVHNQKMLELDRQALEAGRNYVDQQVRVGPVSQPDGFAD
jgi:Pyruvate/2-oxoacid:ferredoxin oxidoreductase gamma subunit